MEKTSNTYVAWWGFTLAETLASLVIGAMVLVTMLGMYNRAEKSAAAIGSRLNDAQLPREVLQRIAEDLDTIVALGADTKITIENKLKKGFEAAKLTITKNISGSQGRPREFEEITWQAGYDYDSDVNGLVLYRMHSGMGLEDKLLDEKRADWEKHYPLVPVCKGVTYFKIQVPKGDNFVNHWPGHELPPGIVVTISFAEPFETLAGTMDVLDEEKITRTIAVDRTKKLRFELVIAEGEDEEGQEAKEDTEDQEEATGGEEENIDSGEQEADGE